MKNVELAGSRKFNSKDLVIFISGKLVANEFSSRNDGCKLLVRAAVKQSITWQQEAIDDEFAGDYEFQDLEVKHISLTVEPEGAERYKTLWSEINVC